MNSLLGLFDATSCAKKCFLIPYFKESLHKTIKFCGQFHYFISVNLSGLSYLPTRFITLTLHRMTFTVKEDL